MTLTEYLLRFSISVSITWIFYRVFLSQLTFYNWNRFYLIGYTLLSFVIPFLDVTYWLKEEQLPATVTSGIPAINSLPIEKLHGGVWNHLFLAVIVSGALFALVRLTMQYISFRKLRNQSVLLHQEGRIKVYGSSEMKGALTFGNHIYINHAEHTAEELKRILLHEIVHVKEKHTFDLIMGELVCIFNWYNPFAWLLRRSIRQNLEFIADSNVLSGGADPKQYQYLLLKVTGVPGYNIASHFNISDLKKRIIMINRTKTAKLHLSRFLFSLPLLAVVLLAFRSEQISSAKADIIATITDTVPDSSEKSAIVEKESQHVVSDSYNNKGYSIAVVTTDGEAVVLIRQRGKKGVTAMTIDEWNENREVNEQKYGKLPPPPPPPPVPEAAPEPRPSAHPVPATPPAPPAPPSVPKKVKDKSQTNVKTLEQQALVEAQVELQEKQHELQEAQVILRELAINVKHQEKVTRQQEIEQAKVKLEPARKQAEQHRKQKKFMGVSEKNEDEN